MASRILPIFGALAILGLVVLLALPALRGPGNPVASPEGPVNPVAIFEQQTSGGLLEAELFLLPDLGYQLDLRVSLDPSSSPPRILRPSVILEMEGMDMGRTEPSLTMTGAGDFSAIGTFAMPGRWRFRLGFESELYDLRVDVPPASRANSAPTSRSSQSSFGHLMSHLGGSWL